MHRASIVFLLREREGVREVCLAKKLTTHLVGLLNGYGGKVEESESALDCARRELYTESGVRALSLEYVAQVDIFENGEREWELHIFTSEVWRGEPHASPEMGEPAWYTVDSLPTTELPADTAVWLPHALQGGWFRARVQRRTHGFADHAHQEESREDVFVDRVDFVAGVMPGDPT